MAEDQITAGEYAADFGYTVSFFKSVPELYSLLRRAVDDGYTQGRFIAELQNTKWFRTSSEPYRKYVALKSSDPASFTQRLNSTQEHIRQTGNALGAILNYSESRKLADQAMQFGWTDEQLKAILADRIKKQSDGLYRGQAGAVQQQIRQLVADYGVGVSSRWIENRVRESVTGQSNAETVRAAIQKLAASKYTALKDRIMGGETVRDIADPYMQSMAKILELNGENIDIDDPLVQRALQARDAKGQPTTQTLYDFEHVLRNDKRWAKTKNAQDQMSAVANDVLKTFGLRG